VPRPAVVFGAIKVTKLRLATVAGAQRRDVPPHRQRPEGVPLARRTGLRPSGDVMCDDRLQAHVSINKQSMSKHGSINDKSMSNQ